MCLFYSSVIAVTVFLTKLSVVSTFAVNASKYQENPPSIKVHDLVRAIKPITDDRNILTVHTSRSIPNWSHVKKDGKIRYIKTLIFIDLEVKRSFNNDKRQIRRGIASLIHGLNMYMHQIDTRIIVLDVMEMLGHNITLEQLSTYRNHHLATLPPHDLAILIRYGYDGGIAYVNGICGHLAVGITGFLPEAPLEYAAVFFHELAHLLGLTHDSQSDCSCGRNEEPCLKIDGFDECSVQSLVERLPLHQCIQKPPITLPKTVLPICGNHFVEPGEECDCGPEKYCKSLVCNAVTCQRTITDMQMFVSVGILIVCVIIVIVCCKWSHQRKDKAEPSGREASLISTKTWNTPTFTPLKNSHSDPEIPIWKTPPYSNGQESTFATITSSEALTNAFNKKPTSDSNLLPLPPRSRDYVNISRATKSSEDISGKSEDFWNENKVSEVNGQSVARPGRKIDRDLNKAIVRRPPPIPYLLDIGTLELPPKNDDTKANSNNVNYIDEEKATSSDRKPRKLLINNPLNCVVPLPRTEEQERQHLDFINALTNEIFSTPLTEIDTWNKNEEANSNDMLLRKPSDAEEKGDCRQSVDPNYDEQEPETILLNF